MRLHAAKTGKKLQTTGKKKGVPKFPTKYNPYRRTSKRNSSVENPSSLDDVTYQSSYPASSSDSFHGSSGVTSGDHAGAALGSEPAVAVAAAVPGTSNPSMSLGAVDEAGHFVDPPLVNSASSPRRKSYLWKRSAKPNNAGAQAQPAAPAAVAAGITDTGASRGGGSVGAVAGGIGGRESGGAGETGALGTVDEAAATVDVCSPLSSSSASSMLSSSHPSNGDAMETVEEVSPTGLVVSPTGGGSAADENPAAAVEGENEMREKDANGVRRWPSGAGVEEGMTGTTVGYLVQGCEDGRFGHTFEVRGPSFATDKAKVNGSNCVTRQLVVYDALRSV